MTKRVDTNLIFGIPRFYDQLVKELNKLPHTKVWAEWLEEQHGFKPISFNGKCFDVLEFPSEESVTEFILRWS